MITSTTTLTPPSYSFIFPSVLYSPTLTRIPITPFRRGPLSGLEDDVSRVFLSREDSLWISSVEYEAFINRLRPLTSWEEKEVKKQRRLIKNREYATNHRKRQRKLIKNREYATSIPRFRHDKNPQLTDKIDQLNQEKRRVKI